MLRIERLKCAKPKYHTKCYWTRVQLQYPDTRFLLLKRRLANEVAHTNMAYRIFHNKFGLLSTIKLGHDGILFIQDDKDAIKKMAGF